MQAGERGNTRNRIGTFRTGLAYDLGRIIFADAGFLCSGCRKRPAQIDIAVQEPKKEAWLCLERTRTN